MGPPLPLALLEPPMLSPLFGRGPPAWLKAGSDESGLESRPFHFPKKLSHDGQSKLRKERHREESASDDRERVRGREQR